MATCAPDRVLSIQSHVVFGYVGNKSAVFPMQLLGFDVCPLNSVQFSNHTGYSEVAGDVLDGTQLLALVKGLEANGLLAFSHVLTGYIGSASFLRAVVSVVETVRRASPDVKYVCDPVLGDNGKLYVPEALVDIYKAEVVPIASILTPNQFECELLSGVPITDEASIFVALEALHGMGVPTVLVTSTSLPSGQDSVMTVIASTTWESVEDNLVLWGGSRKDTAHARFKLTIPKLAHHFTGTGDLTAALTLAWSHRLPTAFVTACENTIASVQAVCARTGAGLGESSTALDRELKVVHSKADLETPVVTIRAEAL